MLLSFLNSEIISCVSPFSCLFAYAAPPLATIVCHCQPSHSQASLHQFPLCCHSRGFDGSTVYVEPILMG
ncbi:hypothetical protein RJT34_19958 [Clitoria ternatea]|uniref:Uncharacterized protein n=1 Tax=Clitoria ternatea TaxID=43366 RepID=A0AAN9P4I1_CLITE